MLCCVSTTPPPVPPCRPCHASAPSFRLPPPAPAPCPLPHLLWNLAAHLLGALSLSRLRFLYPAGGAGGRVGWGGRCSRIKRKGGKKKTVAGGSRVARWLKRLHPRPLVVWPSGIRNSSSFLGTPDHLEVTVCPLLIVQKRLKEF